MSEFLSRLKQFWQSHRFAGDGAQVLDRETEEKAQERKALIYTIAMHLILLLFLIFNINWKSSEPQAMQAEIWTPQQLAAATAAAQREAQTYGAGGGINVTIMARDAESFRQSRTQVAADIARAVSLGRRGM